jgi:hypothetical protein
MKDSSINQMLVDNPEQIFSEIEWIAMKRCLQ